ncbi:MAG: hypothetical protein ABSF63_03470 [Candidatus Bathyarchaeia archaeon]
MSNPTGCQGAGRIALEGLSLELSNFGLTVANAVTWAEQEPTFTKRNFTALDPKRQLYRT